MEDNVTEAENLVHPSNHNYPNKESKGVVDEVEEKSSGFINNLISNVMSKSRGDHVQDAEKLKEGDGLEQEQSTGSCSSGGGLINNLISNLGEHYWSPKAEELVKQHENENGKEEEEEEDHVGSSSSVGNGGGLINSLISNMFHNEQRDQLGEVEGKHQKDRTEQDHEGVKLMDEKENGIAAGGIIEKIVSHLPASLPDDAVPSTDEASILIHSIVRD